MELSARNRNIQHGCRALTFCLLLTQTLVLNKQSNCWWLYWPWCSCYIIIIMVDEFIFGANSLNPFVNIPSNCTQGKICCCCQIQLGLLGLNIFLFHNQRTGFRLHQLHTSVINADLSIKIPHDVQMTPNDIQRKVCQNFDTFIQENTISTDGYTGTGKFVWYMYILHIWR